MKQRQSPFQTADFYLASFLLSQGTQLKAVDRTNPRRVVFIFKGRVSEATIASFWHEDTLVAVQPFIANIRQLKRILYKEEQLGGER
jgi:hypothetical protein